MKVYMIVTNDKYELPLAVADTADGLARLTGKTKNTILSCLSHRRKKSIYKRVEIEED